MPIPAESPPRQQHPAIELAAFLGKLTAMAIVGAAAVALWVSTPGDALAAAADLCRSCPDPLLARLQGVVFGIILSTTIVAGLYFVLDRQPPSAPSTQSSPPVPPSAGGEEFYGDTCGWRPGDRG